MIRRIISALITLLVLVWIGMVVCDYLNITNEKEPIFCFKKEDLPKNGGTLNVCTGPGYKVYTPHYSSAKYKVAFQPFWMQEPE